VDTLYSLLKDSRLNHTCTVISRVLREECSAMLAEFFAELRRQKKNELE
jgi:tRNA(adenine34) deaminase